VLAGLGAAFAWTSSTLLNSASSRRIGAASTLAWVMLFGFVVAVPLAVAAGMPEDDLTGATIARLAVSGAGNVIGLALVYTGVRYGRVAVVTSLASTQGAIAALLAIGAGERPGALPLAGFALVATGVTMVVFESAEDAERADPRRARVSIVLGAAAGLVFGISLFATGEASDAVPATWIALPARIVGVAVLLVALAAGMRPLVRPAAARLAMAGGTFEVLGFISYAIGAREEVAVTSVIASQFAALTVVGAWIVFHERLVRRQVAGVGVLAVGVALVALGGA
jgi:drug/metabolite transporter (DMT)-like permease